MSVSLLFTISDRAKLTDFVSVLKENGIDINFISLGYGTATNEVLGRIGLSKTEKALCISVVSDESWRKVRRAYINTIKIDIPGVGIAFTVPLSSIGGRREFNFFMDKQEYKNEGVSKLEGTKQELIVCVCNQGFSELVMDAARKQGAGGGTVIHARGTGMEKAEHFLGISLASEKDVVYIVTPSEKRNDIMDCIMRDAGLDTDAKAVVFSLPVTDTAGIRFEEDE